MGRYVAKVCQFVNVRGAKHMQEGSESSKCISHVEVSAVRKFLPAHIYFPQVVAAGNMTLTLLARYNLMRTAVKLR